MFEYHQNCCFIKSGVTPGLNLKNIANHMRLNKFIANSGICSRRKADELISKGKIFVNGTIVNTLGYKIDEKDIIKYDNKILNKEKPTYILLNKPKNYICTSSDPYKRNTILDLIKNATKERVYTIGRLDRNTTGLILLTNDGFLAQKLSHPSNKIQKKYYVTLDKELSFYDKIKIEKGLNLEDGIAKVDQIEMVANNKTKLFITIHIGKNRIVRRIFESLGYKVVKLDRVEFAILTKKKLPQGKWRFLSKDEIFTLKKI